MRPRSGAFHKLMHQIDRSIFPHDALQSTEDVLKLSTHEAYWIRHLAQMDKKKRSVELRLTQAILARLDGQIAPIRTLRSRSSTSGGPPQQESDIKVASGLRKKEFFFRLVQRCTSIVLSAREMIKLSSIRLEPLAWGGGCTSPFTTKQWTFSMDPNVDRHENV